VAPFYLRAEWCVEAVGVIERLMISFLRTAYSKIPVVGVQKGKVLRLFRLRNATVSVHLNKLHLHARTSYATAQTRLPVTVYFSLCDVDRAPTAPVPMNSGANLK
jgi:hypothetical protein